MKDLINSGGELNSLLTDIRQLLQAARNSIARTVNTTLIATYWQVGRHIVEFEQGGSARANYRQGLIDFLSKHLKAEFGAGFNATNLRLMRRLFLDFPIQQTLSVELSWSHYSLLLKVENKTARSFYIDECVKSGWSVRQLQRQINTMFYERLLSSKDKEVVRKEIETTAPRAKEPREVIKDPYILEFLGISQGEHFLESDLEQMLITRLQHFLLELGRGFTFVARQKRITFDNKHFYIDLVFYNILTRSYVLVDLKTDELTHQDLGQMQMYVNYYTRELMNPGDNPPIGIVLCAEKNDTMVKYTLPEGQKQIFAAQYMTYMPSQEELKKLLSE